MIDIQAARDLKKELQDCFTSRGMKAAEALITSIEDEYGELLPDSAVAAPPPRTLREWQVAIHEYAKAKGWWNPNFPRSFGDICALFHTEISEAYEEHRAGKAVTEVYESTAELGKPEGIPVEIADLVIRVLDWCEHEGVDLQTVLVTKHRYNLTREDRHGGKRT